MQKNLPDSFEHEQNVIDFAGLYSRKSFLPEMC